MTSLFRKSSYVAIALVLVTQLIASASPALAQAGEAEPPAAGDTTPALTGNQAPTIIQQQEEETIPCSAWDPWCWPLIGLDYLISALGRIVAYLPRVAFVGTINLNTSMYYFEGIPAVYLGWQTSRDVANLFFIIILIIVAISTIFELPTFNVKDILPKLIFIALAINFSFSIGIFIIKQTNSLGSLFYSQLAPPGTTISDTISKVTGSRGAVAFLSGKNFGASGNTSSTSENTDSKDKVLEFLKSDDSKIFVQKFQWDDTCQNWYDVACKFQNVKIGYAECYDRDTVANYSRKKQDACALWQGQAQRTSVEQISGDSGVYLRYATGILAKVFIFPITAFVMLAGAVLLLGRIVSLMFILILAPLAFLSYLIPGQSQYWSEWWNQLFKKSFFFPAFMFCLMFSFQILDGIKNTSGTATDDLIGYGLGVAFMLGSMIVASKMGVMGAATATGLGKKLQSWAKTKAKNTGWRAGGYAAEKTLAGLGHTPIAGTRLGRIAAIPLEGVAGRRKKILDAQEKRRVDRLKVAAGVKGFGGEGAEKYMAQRFMGEKTDYQDEFIKTAKPNALAKITKGMTADQIRKLAERQDNPKDKEKVYNSIKEIDKRVEAQSGQKLIAPEEHARLKAVIDELTKAGKTAEADTEQKAYDAKKEPDTQATAQVLSSMTSEDLRGIKLEDLQKKDSLRDAIVRLGGDTNLIKNIGNDAEKVKEIGNILKEKAGYKDRALKDIAEKVGDVVEGNTVVIPAAENKTIIKTAVDQNLTPEQKIEIISREYEQEAEKKKVKVGKIEDDKKFLLEDIKNNQERMLATKEELGSWIEEAQKATSAITDEAKKRDAITKELADKIKASGATREFVTREVDNNLPRGFTEDDRNRAYETYYQKKAEQVAEKMFGKQSSYREYWKKIAKEQYGEFNTDVYERTRQELGKRPETEGIAKKMASSPLYTVNLKNGLPMTNPSGYTPATEGGAEEASPPAPLPTPGPTP